MFLNRELQLFSSDCFSARVLLLVGIGMHLFSVSSSWWYDFPLFWIILMFVNLYVGLSSDSLMSALSFSVWLTLSYVLVVKLEWGWNLGLILVNILYRNAECMYIRTFPTYIKGTPSCLSSINDNMLTSNIRLIIIWAFLNTGHVIGDLDVPDLMNQGEEHSAKQIGVCQKCPRQQGVRKHMM